MKCPNCERRIKKDDIECRHCGYPLGNMARHRCESTVITEGTTHSIGEEGEFNNDYSDLEEAPKQVHTGGGSSSGSDQAAAKKGCGCVTASFAIVFGVIAAMIGLGLWLNHVDDNEAFYEELVTEEYSEEDTYVDQEAMLEAVEVYYYTYTDSLDTSYLLFEFNNTSEYDLYVDVDVELLDESGNPLDTKEGSIRALGADTVYMMPILMDDAVDFNIYLYFEKEAWYTTVNQNLEVIHKTLDGEEVVTVRNTGDIPIDFAEAKILFFNGDTIVSFQSAYFMDQDNELKPGQSRTEKFNPYETYDYVIVYAYGNYYEY